MPSLAASRSTRRVLVQIAVVPLVAGIVALGVWVAGGLVTDDFRESVALTTVWFGIAAGLCLLTAARSRTLRVPVIASYLVTAGAIGIFLASTTLRDHVVSERVVMGVDPAGTALAGRSANVRLARGRFTSGEHETRGVAAIIRLPDGRTFLTLTAFTTSPGPDLRVRLAPSRTLDAGAADAIDLGALKGNRGDQQYGVPGGVDLRGRAVVIWCRAFSARFGSAVLAFGPSTEAHGA